jgi:hypothetical protein
MADGQLLLMVQLTCSREHLEPFTLWYNSHLPNLLRIPGYLWAQRFVNLDGTNRFTALYGIRSAADLPSLLQFGGPELHPTAAAEFSVFSTLQGISEPVSNVYEQISGASLRDPLLVSDLPLSIVSADVDPAHEDEWDRWYTDSHLAGVLSVPGYARGARFRRLDHPALADFNTGPRYLALYECDSEEILPTLVPGDRIRPEASAELDRWLAYGAVHARNFRWGFYRLVSKHYKWTDVLSA